MGKPTGGERPICQAPGSYRLYCKVRNTQVLAWEFAKAGHWDTAVRGCSPLGAALIREVSN
eukprot:5315733-Heterocapsa_arctica.AAC.1